MSAPFWSVVAVGAFWCWVACVGLCIARAFLAGRQFIARQALLWGGLAILCAIVWAVGLTRA